MQMASSRLLLVSFFLVFLMTLVSAMDHDYRWGCVPDYFSDNSSYATNLYNLFSQLNSTSDFNHGFYNLSVGNSSDQVNAIALCRGDQNETTCKSCLNEAISDLKRVKAIALECSNSTEAYLWLGLCNIYYTSREIIGYMESHEYQYVSSVKNISGYGLNVTRYNQDVNTLLNNLSSQAAAGGSLQKYAAGKLVDLGYYLTVYAQVQCTPDLSEEDCTTCLSDAMGRINSFCSQFEGCRVLHINCNLRYENYQFFTTVGEGITQPSPPPASNSKETGKKSSKRTQTITRIGVSVGSFLLLVVIFCIWKCLRLQKSKRNVETSKDEMNTVESLQYDFAIVKEATNRFSNENKLGQGGFGAVYKGNLPNGQAVAVKRLSSVSRQGNKEFKNEVQLVAKLQHRNLVRLIGFCLEGDERLLIYEFVPNSSLDHFLFDPTRSSQLGWEGRYRIIGGIARGLVYLHEDSRLRIIHRDLKAGNILLDQDMNPKIADFGMAMLFSEDETHGIASRIVGTFGYMAPEYINDGHFSVKSDVFSFGVLLLEIVSGQRNNSSRNAENKTGLIRLVWKHWREGTELNFIDPTLRSSGSSTAEMVKCIHIGLLCVQENVDDRPTMASVVHILTGNSTALPAPLEPTYLMSRTLSTIASDMSSSSGNNSRDESLRSSNNGVTITEPYPR